MSARKVAHSAVARLEGGFAVAVVEQDVAGYVIDLAEPTFDRWESASARAAEKNSAMQVSPREAWEIVASSLRKSVETGVKWGPRGS